MNSAQRIEHTPVSELVPYAANARTHSEDQINLIAASIKEFGFNNPVLIDTDNGIIAGHGRVMAAMKLGLDIVPTVTLDHLNDVDRRAYILADNRLALDAGWDDAILSSELKRLESEIDLSLLGFDDKELTKLLSLQDDHVLGADDVVPEMPKTPVNVLGDVWLLGDHRLMCGDSTNGETVEKLMDGQVADMVFTDPPYALFGNSTGVVGITDDNMVRSFFRDVMIALKMNVKLYGHIYMCCDWHSAFSIEGVARSVELKSKNLCIWDKGDGGVGAMYQQCYEMVWFFDNSPTAKTVMGRTNTGVRTVNGKPNIWRVNRQTTDRIHNAQKPVELIRIPISCSSDRGDLVLDLFGGSGSTLIAAECETRIAYMMELDPKYCDVIINRWQDYTGKQAIHAETGKPFEVSNVSEKIRTSTAA